MGFLRALYPSAERWFQATITLACVVHRGLWLGLLDSGAACQATLDYYARSCRYSDESHNCSGLLSWESQALERHFPRQGRVLVLGAGGGREVIALAAKGFEVEGFECCPPLAERANRLLDKTGIGSRVVVIAPNEVPSVHGFDAAVVGWGAYMHVPGQTRRIRFLRALRAALEPGGPLLLSFFARRGTGRSDLWAARLANSLRTVLGHGDDPVEVGDRLQGSFDHYFTEDEIREEMEASGFRLAHYSDAEYPHAVGVAT
jgi:SAM-dependent methyltransferase